MENVRYKRTLYENSVPVSSTMLERLVQPCSFDFLSVEDGQKKRKKKERKETLSEIKHGKPFPME